MSEEIKLSVEQNSPFVIVGEPAGFGTVTATVDTNVGTPSVEVTSSGKDTAKNFSFEFKNLGYDDSDLQEGLATWKGGVESDIDDIEADFDTLQGQFDTAVAALTVDSEVADVRVGADGTTYTSAGAAVRGQVSDLKSEFIDLTKCTVEQGKSLDSSTGALSISTNFTTITTFVPVLSGAKVRLIHSGFAFRVCKYSAPLASTFTGSTGSSFRTSDYTVTEDCYIRIAIRFDPSSAPSPTKSELCNNIAVVMPRGVTENQRLFNIIDYADVYRNMYIVGTEEAKTYNASEYYSVTNRIKVLPKQVYYLHWKSTNSGGSVTANLPAVRIFAFDEDDDCVKIGGNNTSATQYHFYNCGVGTSGAEEYVLLMFPSNVEYIQIQYDATSITDSNITFESNIWEVSYLTQQTYKTEGDIDFVKTGLYTSVKNNDVFVGEFLGVAESYYNRKDDNDNYILHYDKAHTVLGNYDGNGGIDCSCFVGLVVRGIPFDETEYNDVESDYDANPDYKWSINPYRYDLERNNYQQTISRVRTAAQLANMYYLMGRQVWIDTHLANIQRGDILFFARKSDETEEYIQPRRFENISHTAIVYDVEDAPEDATWDTDKYPYQHTLIEVVNVQGAVRFDALEKHSGEYQNGPDTLVMIARPALGTITPIDVDTNTIVIGDVTLTLNVGGSVTWSR